MRFDIPRRLACLAIALAPVSAAAQGERFSLAGSEVAVYNLVGRMQVEGGAGDRVVVEVTRRGQDASRLTIATGNVRGRSALRVRYPADRIVYAARNWRGRTTLSVRDDDTFGDSVRDGERGGRRIDIASSGSGLEAHADLRIVVPPGRTLFLRNGMGETTIDNVDGRLDVHVASSRVRVARVRGSLVLDTGSGGVEVTDHTGDLELDSGSGGAVLDGVRGGTVRVDVGSGSLRGRSLDVRSFTADVGSGGVRLSGVRTPALQLESGSGSTDVELLAPVTDVRIEAGSGGVTLRMPAALDATLDIETGSGGIDTDFDVTVQKLERRALKGRVGAGRGTVRVESGSGSVRILKS